MVGALAQVPDLCADRPAADGQSLVRPPSVLMALGVEVDAQLVLLDLASRRQVRVHLSPFAALHRSHRIVFPGKEFVDIREEGETDDEAQPTEKKKDQ